MIKIHQETNIKEHKERCLLLTGLVALKSTDKNATSTALRYKIVYFLQKYEKTLKRTKSAACS